MPRIAIVLAAAAAVVSLAPPASAQDAARGRQLVESRCFGCHSLDQNRVGPALGTVFGRRAGSHAGYSYSAALKGAGHAWDEASLDKWLTNPQAFVPGAAMPFRLSDARERADVIAFLKSLKK
jgi:cytochrome c